MRVFNNVGELEQATGTHLGYSDWHSITQEQINAFALATGDSQWIHVDTERAAAGPFGTTIAHGYLTLSLVSSLAWQIFRIDGTTMQINYGAEKIRFPSPVPVDSRVRAGVELLSTQVRADSCRMVTRVTIERQNGDKPACVVDVVSMLLL